MHSISIWQRVCITLLFSTYLHAAPTPQNQTEPKPKKNLEADAGGGILQFANPLHQDMLNNSTQAVKKLPDPDIDRLIDSMLIKMRANKGGVGISANQVGKSLQISIVTSPFTGDSTAYEVYINPVITEASESTHCFWHGCLSDSSDKFGKVSTWQTITVSAQDQKGKVFTKKLQGFDAIIFQHEFRHLLGGGYLDHSSAYRSEKEMIQAMMDQMQKGTFKHMESCDDGHKPLLDGYKTGEKIEEYAKRITKKALDKEEKKPSTTRLAPPVDQKK